ncbi:MAG: methyltransferase domain-containing protein, partial [Chitinophagaceae bacterium]
VGLYDDIADQCPDNYFDLVICNDVIEHMPDHDSFLEKIKVKMTGNAYIFGSIPNVRYIGNLFKLLVKKDWNYESQGVLDKTHLRFFTQKSLMDTFNHHGYRLEQVAGVRSDLGRWQNFSFAMRNAILCFVIAITFGHSADIQFTQFAFVIENKLGVLFCL